MTITVFHKNLSGFSSCLALLQLKSQLTTFLKSNFLCMFAPEADPDCTTYLPLWTLTVNSSVCMSFNVQGDCSSCGRHPAVYFLLLLGSHQQVSILTAVWCLVLTEKAMHLRYSMIPLKGDLFPLVGSQRHRSTDCTQQLYRKTLRSGMNAFTAVTKKKKKEKKN